MGIRDRLARFAQRIGEQRERPSRGDARIDLAQAAGRGIARIGEYLLPRARLCLVQLEEIRLGHEHFAADLDQRRRTALQPVGDRFHGAQIGRDVLAFGAVAARRAAHEAAMFVGEVDRQPVDLRFGDERERRIRREAHEAARTSAEFGEFLGVHRVVEREHRHAVADLGEAALRRVADAVGGRVRTNQLRKTRLDRGVAQAQRIVIRVGNLRRVLLMV